MSLKIIMYISGILGGLAFVSLMIIYGKLLVDSIKGIFQKKKMPKDDEAEKERMEKEHALNKLTKLLLVGTLAGMGFCLVCWVILKVPRGADSLFQKNTEDAQGVDNATTIQQDREQNMDSKAEGTENDVGMIVVNGKAVCIGEVYFENMDELDRYLDDMDSEKELREMKLKDDYAVAGTFHAVETLLEEKAIEYEVVFDE